jgi:hypothetical protein
MQISITDTAHNKSHLKVPGNATIAQVCDAYRTKCNLPVWDVITIKRCDDGVFWVEDKGEYVVAVRYDPDADPRPKCTIRIETATEFGVYVVENYQPATEDPIAVWADICEPWENLLGDFWASQGQAGYFQIQDPYNTLKSSTPASIAEVIQDNDRRFRSLGDGRSPIGRDVGQREDLGTAIGDTAIATSLSIYLPAQHG